MKISLLEVMLLINIVWVGATCEEGDIYVYSHDYAQAQRCRDERYFYYTQRYTNNTFCTALKMDCWWDTSIESHCLETTECVWLDDHVSEGMCYCRESSDCDACVDETPAPTITSSFECPEDCNVFFVGCVGMYCNCLSECATAEELGCTDPVDPHCHTWHNLPITTPEPTPTQLGSVYWSCKICCLVESKITLTTSSVATALGLDVGEVSIFSYKQAKQGRRPEDIFDETKKWEIVYKINVKESGSTMDLVIGLEGSIILNLIEEQINADLEIQLESIETISVGEIEPVYTPSPGSSIPYSMIGGIVGGVFIAFLLGFMFYRYYTWKNRGVINYHEVEVDTDEVRVAGRYDY